MDYRGLYARGWKKGDLFIVVLKVVPFWGFIHKKLFLLQFTMLFGLAGFSQELQNHSSKCFLMGLFEPGMKMGQIVEVLLME